MEVELHRGRHQLRPFWHVWHVDDLSVEITPEEVLLDEVLREQTAAANFKDVIQCVCDRRWRALFDPPQVVEERNQ